MTQQSRSQSKQQFHWIESFLAILPSGDVRTYITQGLMMCRPNP